MNCEVKIIKRDHAKRSHTSPLHRDEKPGQPSDREIAGTVKNWIAELAQQRRANELTARTRFLAATHS
ncbi:MAG TPA: hypothetical protein VFR78_12720 [Pyrinomonadaceae bacterium]|nr:hypothetical protein [Pyrinomonadaceae bacterium]